MVLIPVKSGDVRSSRMVCVQLPTATLNLEDGMEFVVVNDTANLI